MNSSTLHVGSEFWPLGHSSVHSLEPLILALIFCFFLFSLPHIHFTQQEDEDDDNGIKLDGGVLDADADAASKRKSTGCCGGGGGGGGY